jgi:hypothetical protein
LLIIFLPFHCLQVVHNAFDPEERSLCILRHMSQKPEFLLIVCKCRKHFRVRSDRETSAADLQASRHNRLYSCYIARAEFLEILRRNVQFAHTVRDVFDAQRLSERTHQDGILLVYAQTGFDLNGIFLVDRPEKRRDFLLNLRKIEQIDRFSVTAGIAHRLCAGRDRVVQAFPLLTRRNEAGFRVLAEKCQRNVRIMLEYATLKPQEICVFLRILPDLAKCFCTCIFQINCICLVLHHVYLPLHFTTLQRESQGFFTENFIFSVTKFTPFKNSDVSVYI